MRFYKYPKFVGVISVCLVVILINIAMFKFIPAFASYDDRVIMGGNISEEDFEAFANAEEQYIKPDDNYIERFLRPSNLEVMDKEYSFSNEGDKLPKSFDAPSGVIKAYFDVLSDASNLGSKKGGCGSIGFEKAPYPSAYNLLSESLKKAMSYDRFLKSFEGVGHINLLKLTEAPAVKIGSNIYPRFLVEIEAIEGSDTPGKTSFAYYFGYVIAEQDKAAGWRITSIELMPEDFLCHAYHGWWHDAGTIVEVQYKNKYGIIEKILGVEESGYLRNVLAKDKDGKQYRFTFVRITNGADIELRQYVMEGGKWKDIRIDTSQKTK